MANRRFYPVSFPRLLIVATLAFPASACASAGADLRPCVDVREREAPPICTKGASKAQCRKDEAFVRRQIQSTVTVWVASHSPDIGMTFKSGTGTVIDDRGRVLTAEHVVSGAMWVAIATRRLSDDGKSFIRVRDIPMRVVISSPSKDVALLAPIVREKLPPPMPMIAPERKFEPGETLWQFGNTSYWQRGAFVANDVSRHGLSGLLKVDIVSDGGDSGGPLVTSQGEIAGVLVRNDKFGESPTYFVPLAAALAELVNDK